MTDDLWRFVLDCLTDDEKVAKAAAERESGHWHTSVEETGDGENAYYAVADDDHMADDFGYFADFAPRGPGSGANRAEHIARWDPARVLAESEAKRRVVEALAARGEDAGLTSEADKGATWAFRETCRALALPYADHPDYRKEWRP